MDETKREQLPMIIEIRVSRMLPGQIGVFAVRALDKDQIIAEAANLGERFVSWAEFKKIDGITQAKMRHYCLQTPEGLFVPVDFNYLSVPWNINHSCSYNVGFDEEGNFVATRPVEEGEELCWDYGMGISYTMFRMECKCGSPNCRKVITGNDWKNLDFVAQNRKYFLRELLQSIDAAMSASIRRERR